MTEKDCRNIGEFLDDSLYHFRKIRDSGWAAFEAEHRPFLDAATIYLKISIDFCKFLDNADSLQKHEVLEIYKYMQISKYEPRESVLKPGYFWKFNVVERARLRNLSTTLAETILILQKFFDREAVSREEIDRALQALNKIADLYHYAAEEKREAATREAKSY